MSRKRTPRQDDDSRPPSVESIEDLLIGLGKRLNSEDLSGLRHESLGGSAEWRGADVVISDDFAWEPKNFMEAHDLRVRTRHSVQLSWLFVELRNAFSFWLHAGNKYGFYGSLAQAALDHLAAHQPESEDPRPLVRAALDQAFRWLKVLRETGGIPEDSQCVLHIQDVEGRQRRIDLESGEDTH